jgi:hypothetical protein
MIDTATESRIEVRLERIERLLGELLARLAESPRRAKRQSSERPDDLVYVSYVAALFGCSEKSARAGKAGTKGVPWVRDERSGRVRPLRATRRGVHEAHRAYISGQRSRGPGKGLIRRKPAESAS